MPTGSFIPKFYLSHKNMPLSIYIAWWIFGFNVAFYGGHTYIYLQTNRQQFYDTMICLWHGRNEFWHPERGSFTEPRWEIHIESMHWVILAHVLEERGFPWTSTKVLSTDNIQCMDEQIEGQIFGIKSFALFD